MSPIVRAAIPVVVQQHADDAAALRNTRSSLVSAPHVKLHHLRRLDDRIAAHLDGLAVAGALGNWVCREALSPPGVGPTFNAIVRAIEDRDVGRLHELLAIARLASESRRGALSAFGWVSGGSLRGITHPLLESNDPWWREVGLVACAMHQVDPSTALLEEAMDAPDVTLKARALRVAGGLGRIEHRDACIVAAREDAEPSTMFEAARAALILGDRTTSLASLGRLAAAPNAVREAAIGLLLKVGSSEAVLALLKSLRGEPAAIRTLIRAIGVAGNSHFVPWLIDRMDDLRLSRLAGESFSLITGLDFAHLDLDRKPPEDVDFGPSNDPNDTNVEIDEDDSLPWPDPARTRAWWNTNGARFTAGTRYFMGQTPTKAHCLSVLQAGFQRQRRHAAEYLCLLEPGTPLFNIAAPAWRQQRLLAQMSGS